MGIKISITNFLINSKRNKKEIIIWAIITFVITSTLGHYALTPLYSYIDDNILPKPEILVMSMVFKQTGGYGVLHEFPRKASFSYFLGTEFATMYIISPWWDEKYEKKFRKSDLFGVMPLNINFNECPNCSYYYFSLKNIGNKKADRIVIDIKSSKPVELVKEINGKNIVSPKMTGDSNCGGIFENRGCYIILENINQEENVSLVFKTNTTSADLYIASCTANDKYNCDVGFVEILTDTTFPTRCHIVITEEGKKFSLCDDVIMANDKRIQLPRLDNFGEPNTWYRLEDFDDSKAQWIMITTKEDNIEWF